MYVRRKYTVPVAGIHHVGHAVGNFLAMLLIGSNRQGKTERRTNRQFHWVLASPVAPDIATVTADSFVISIGDGVIAGGKPHVSWYASSLAGVLACWSALEAHRDLVHGGRTATRSFAPTTTTMFTMKKLLYLRLKSSSPP